MAPGSLRALLVLAMLGCAAPELTPDAGLPDAGPTPLECPAFVPGTVLADQLMGHAVRVDAEGRLLPWLESTAPYPIIASRAFDALSRVPIQPDGFPTYYGRATFKPAPDEFQPGDYLSNNIGSLTAMLIDSALAYAMYSGDRAPIALVQAMADHVLDVGLTEPTDDWPSVPYATGDPGATIYRGASFVEGNGVIEPDKVGELGNALLRLYEVTGEVRYRDAAVRCATALATHVRAGDELHSPWPFRVEAATNAIREEYTADMIGPIMLFDRALRLGLGDATSLSAARDTAWQWLLRYPFENELWSAYFEDIPEYPPANNQNQLIPLETALYLMEHPELDPDWQAHARSLIDFAARTFAIDVQVRLGPELGHQYGAEVLSEQDADVSKMGSHTARFAAVLARYAERTGDADAQGRATRSFNWATYTSDDRGVVRVGQNDDEGYWFSDGYGDYVRHFFRGLGAIPAWAPCGEAHLLHSTSEVQWVEREADVIRYRVADQASREVLRLPGPPTAILLPDGSPAPTAHAIVEPLPSGDVVVHLERSGEPELAIHF